MQLRTSWCHVHAVDWDVGRLNALLHRQMWLWQLCFKEDLLFGKGLWGISVKKNPQLLFPSPTTIVYTARTKYNDFEVCAFDSNHCTKIVKEGIYRDPCHWQEVLPELTTFWRVCILLEILGRWYMRKCDLSCKVQQTLAGICFCRMPSARWGQTSPCLCASRVGRFFQNGAEKVCKGLWVSPYWILVLKWSTLTQFCRNLVLAMQIWRPFQEIANFYHLVDIYQG